jgi:hypothetical protein
LVSLKKKEKSLLVWLVPGHGIVNMVMTRVSFEYWVPLYINCCNMRKKKSNVFVESHRISHVSILVVELKQENESKKYHKHHVRKLKQDNDMLKSDDTYMLRKYSISWPLYKHEKLEFSKMSGQFQQ